MGLVLNIDEENVKDIMNMYFKNAYLITLIRKEEKIYFNIYPFLNGYLKYMDQEKNLIINFLFDFLSMFLENKPNMKIIPGFHHQDSGITIKVLEDRIILNNVFGFNNGLSKEEQEFFVHIFKEFQNYEDFVNSEVVRKLEKGIQ